jgi:hypothetical protein
MNRGGKVFGIILVVIGALFLTSELGLLNEFYARYNITLGSIFSNTIGAMIRLWPLILIAVGVTIIFKNRIVSNIVWILFVLIIGFFAITGPANFSHMGMPWVWSSFNSGSNVSEGVSNYSDTVDYNTAMKKGVADIQLGAGSTNILSSDAKALMIKSQLPGFTSSWKVDSDTLKINIGQEGPINIGNGVIGSTDVSLGNKLIWDINVSTGASDFNMDLKDIQVEKLDFEMGAGAAEIHLGTKAPRTDVTIDAGASSVILYIPKTAGVQIESDSGLSSIEMDSVDLSTIGESAYTSDGYAQAANKISIKLSAGVSSVEIIRE